MYCQYKEARSDLAFPAKATLTQSSHDKVVDIIVAIESAIGIDGTSESVINSEFMIPEQRTYNNG